MSNTLTTSGKTRFDHWCSNIARTVALNPPQKYDRLWAFYGNGYYPDECFSVAADGQLPVPELSRIGADEVILARIDPHNEHPLVDASDMTMLSGVRDLACNHDIEAKVLDLLVVGKDGSFASTDYYAARESFLRGFRNPVLDVDHEEWIEQRGLHVAKAREAFRSAKKEEATTVNPN